MYYSMITPIEGELVILERILTKNYNFRLYKNDHEPSHTSTLESLVEANFKGYSQKPTNPIYVTGWVDHKAFQEYDIAKAIHEKYSWTCTSNLAQTIYGYYISESGGKLILAEKFDSPIEIKCNVLNLEFNVTLKNED